MRARRNWHAVGMLAGALVGALPATAAAQRPLYTPTLYWETGLIDIPAAWVSPLGGDLAFSASRVRFDRDAGGADWWYHASVGGSLWGRAEAGLTVLDDNLNVAMFAKALLWDQLDGEFRRGAMHWLPSVAVGLRNAGTEPRLDRFGLASADVRNTSPTLYAVATRTTVLARDAEGRPRVQAGLTAGIGNGLFNQAGGLDTLYGRSATGGAFGGAQLQLEPSRFTRVSLMVEHNAWDLNAGIAVDLRGVRVGVHMTELGAGTPSSTRDRSYQKMAMTIGWQTNARALLRGGQMERKLDEIEAAQTQLRRDITASTRRVADLERQLRELEGQTATDRLQAKAELERRLREEQEALKRLQERLGKKP